MREERSREDGARDLAGAEERVGFVEDFDPEEHAAHWGQEGVEGGFGDEVPVFCRRRRGRGGGEGGVRRAAAAFDEEAVGG